MKNLVRVIAITALMVSTQGFAQFFPDSDSGITGPAYSKIVAEMNTLAEQYSGWATAVTYGESVSGKSLVMLRISKPDTEIANAPAVQITGATHGNEYLNITDRLPRWFLENRETSLGTAKFFDAGGVLYLVPIVNPDGYDRDRRSNNNGADLNRDFDVIPEGESRFDQPETANLAAYLDQDLTENSLDLEVAVDYHCCYGALLSSWAYTSTPIPADDYARHQVIADLMNEHIDASYDFGATGQVLGYYPWGTSKDYYYAKYGTLAFTFEGKYRYEDDNFTKHTIWWDHILSSLVE